MSSSTDQTTIATTPDAPAVPCFARLGPLAAVGLRHAACLHLHKAQVACRRCAEACPQQCLDLSPGRVGLDAARCTACGRCARACPTAALAVDGFALETLPASRRIACRRQGKAAEGAVRVPCLGGLELNTLLRLVGRVGPAPLQLLDDGSCDACSDAGGTGHPGAALVEALRPLLRACGVPEAAMPTHYRVLPNGNDRGTGSGGDESGGPHRGRRGFFAGLGRAASSAVVRGTASLVAAPAEIPPQARGAVPSPRGYQTRQLMTRLAAGGRVATAWLPEVSVAGACVAHDSCIRMCPTGALQAQRQGSRRSLVFDAWLCIDCGVCAGACPEGALRYTAAAERAFQVAPVELARTELVACPRCGSEIAAAMPGTLCASCSKSASLAQAGFTLFAGLRRSANSAAGPP